jgi:MoaA/NifB/PqqE/SkfB family radical SAM enzyme
MDVRAISLSTSDPSLKDQLESVRNQVAQKQMQLVWNLPVPYSALHPIALETTQWSQFPGAGKDWLYLEPDGDVLPSQGINQVMGNFLTDEWEKIWHN